MSSIKVKIKRNYYRDWIGRALTKLKLRKGQRKMKKWFYSE